MRTHQVFALLACLALSACPVSQAFSLTPGFAPSCSGSFLAGALNNADKIGKTIPGNWNEGQQFTMGGQFAVGDLVFVQRSDGSKRYGEIVGGAGLPWQDQWEVCVQTEGADVGATRVELGKDIGKVVVGGKAAPAAGSMLVGRGAPTPARAPAPRGAPAPVRPTGTARVGSQRVTIPARGQPRAQPRASPPKPKAAPTKISLVARPPPTQAPPPQPRAAPAKPVRGRTPPPAKAAAKTPAAPALPFADKLSRSVPDTWEEGQQYAAAEAVNPKELVLVDSASGLKFGVVLAKTGFFWQQNYKVATSAGPAGAVGSSEEVSLERLFKPSQAALDEMDQPVAAVGGFFAGLLKNLQGDDKPSDKAAPAFAKAAAKPPAQPTGTVLSDVIGGLGSLLPGNEPAAEAPAAPKTPAAKKPAADSLEGRVGSLINLEGLNMEGRVGSLTNIAESATDTGRDMALGFLNGLSKALGDDEVTAPAKEAPKKEAAKKEEPKEAAAKKEEPKEAAAKKEEPKKEEPKVAAPKKEEPKAAAPPAPKPAAPKVEAKTEAKSAEAPKKESAAPAGKTQAPPPGLGLAVPLAKKNTLEENLRRAERPGDLNLGLGPEWEGWTPEEEKK